MSPCKLLSQKASSNAPPLGVILGRDAGFGQGVEQGGFADVGQTHDAAFQTHIDLSVSCPATSTARCGRERGANLHACAEHGHASGLHKAIRRTVVLALSCSGLNCNVQRRAPRTTASAAPSGVMGLSWARVPTHCCQSRHRPSSRLCGWLRRVRPSPVHGFCLALVV